MGRQDVEQLVEGEKHRRFMRALLADLAALERMLEEGMIESGVRRIGAEQEMFLVDRSWRPAPRITEILQRIDDPRVTTELARFNLECNLDPLELTGSCLVRLEANLRELLGALQRAANEVDTELLLTGILPTLDLADLSIENVTPHPRYHALNDVITRMRGGVYSLHIKGADELRVKHDNVMLEALNTSFQVHFQVSHEEFPALFNLAQAITAPVLAAAVNSPILFGKRLWQENRIAIFQQAVDTRGEQPHGRDTIARVRFGEGWVDQSVLEIFRNDIARFRLLMAADLDEDPIQMLDSGHVPKLRALQTHNSTVYRWNRPCYGVTDGKPHLRIENRVLPSGPTVVDEVANAAFWIGLMAGGAQALPELHLRLDFEDASANFIAAARQGLSSQLIWLDGTTLPADRLILDHLLPIARDGLHDAGVEVGDADRYLGILHDRVRSRQTGAQWQLSSAAALKGKGTRAERLASITAAISRRQATCEPVHTWKLAELTECGDRRATFERVGQYMTSDLFTVDQDELIDLVASIMEWEHVRHVPVEDSEHRLVGLVSYRRLLKLLANRRPGDLDEPIAVREIMEQDPLTVCPETTTLEAIELMRKHRVSALPVVRDERLVGIVTEHDFMKLAGELLEQSLRNAQGPR